MHMKQIKTMLLTIAMLLVAPALFPSCQEDAPKINYTTSVSVVNDFTKVVDAINDGTLKNEQAIQKLADAIDKMNADQQTKLQALTDAITATGSTIDAKLTAVEAALKAQTLAVESKLSLLETAIKALPDYSDKLDAIKAVIESLPDYSSKFDAVVAALGDMKTQLEALGTAQTTTADKIAEVTTAVNALVAEVKAGNAGAATAMTKIVEILEAFKAALGGGGSTVPVTGVTLDQVTLDLLGGSMAPLVATVQPADATNKDVTWSSGDETVATVDNTGKVTALAAGTATITATTVDGDKTATCAVTVTAAVTEEYVDLGATKPSDYGDYYAWGETTPKSEYTWENYKWGRYDALTKYNATDGKVDLDPEDDAATATLGASWRMPNEDEISELVNKCTWTWTTLSGIKGYLVKGPNGKSIFLPAAGRFDGSAPRYVGENIYYPSNNVAFGKSCRIIMGYSAKNSQPRVLGT